MSEKKKYQVFISYSSKDLKEDRDLINNIQKTLEDQNISYWDDHKISAGEKWNKGVVDALDQASTYILLVSSNFRSSEWQMYEFGHAISRSTETGTRIIPVITGEGDVPEFLRQFQYIDARLMKDDEISNKLKSILQEKPKNKKSKLN